ncbi:MAG: efflux RND transporter periplasmic adaptor subunit [Gemmatimonadaceae bacterium]
MTSPALPQPDTGALPPVAPAGVVASDKPAATSAPLRLLDVLRRHVMLVIFVVVLAAIAGLFGPRLVLGPLVAVESVVRANFVQSVVASGRVETPHRIDVGVQVTGTVLRVPVTEGQIVAAGATLIQLESSELAASLNQSQHAVQAAFARVRQIAEVQSPLAVQALRQAQLGHDATVDALRRSEALLAGGAISPAARDDARRAEQVAAAQMVSAERQVASARANGSDEAAAQATLSQSRAGADLARARLTYATVRAQRAGTLISRNVEPGDVVQPGRILMTLSPGGETQLVVQIDEKNLQLMRLGLTALASADAYPKDRFAATVVYVNPGVDAQRGAVEVKLTVTSPPSYLKQDMTASVDIEIARRDSATLVPSDAVHDPDSSAPWVYLVTGGHVRRTAVSLGLRSGGLSEVLTGVSPGDRVVPATNLSVHDGTRVRAQLPVIVK